MLWETCASRILVSPIPQGTADKIRDPDYAGRVGLLRRHVVAILLTALLVLPLAIRAPASGLERAPYKFIRGTITPGDGRPIAGATVEICDLRGVAIVAAITDQTGRFEIATQAAEGEYVLLAARDLPLTDERFTLDRASLEIKLVISGTPDTAPRPSRYTVSSRRLGTPAKVRTHLKSAQAHFKPLQFNDAMQALDAAIRLDP